MTVERRNPLPGGRYWIDIFDSKRSAFETWAAVNKDSVHVEVTESHDTNPPRDFYIFTVAERVAVPGGTGTIAVPVQWDAATFGFPTIAGPEIKSSADTVSRPDLPKDATDQISDGLDSIGSLGKSVVVAGIFVGVAILLAKLADKKAGRGSRAAGGEAS